MSSVTTWLMALFESPEVILCAAYFVFRLIYWICTRKKAKTEKQAMQLEQSEVQDIYIATAQLYKLIKEDKNGKTDVGDSTALPNDKQV